MVSFKNIWGVVGLLHETKSLICDSTERDKIMPFKPLPFGTLTRVVRFGLNT